MARSACVADAQLSWHSQNRWLAQIAWWSLGSWLALSLWYSPGTLATLMNIGYSQHVWLDFSQDATFIFSVVEGRTRRALCYRNAVAADIGSRSSPRRPSKGPLIAGFCLWHRNRIANKKLGKSASLFLIVMARSFHMGHSACVASLFAFGGALNVIGSFVFFGALVLAQDEHRPLGQRRIGEKPDELAGGRFERIPMSHGVSPRA